jgi:dTDP-4-dehydrorhamnose reductase
MPRLLVIGATGYLGGELGARARAAGHDVVGTGFSQPADVRLDVRDPAALEALVAEVRPDAIVHTAYLQDGPGAWATTAEGAGHVARAAAGASLRLVHLSTDVVFGGRKGTPYVEEDELSPVTGYGRAKAEAERLVTAHHPGALLVRTSLIYGGPGHEPSKHELAARDPGNVFYDDEIRSPVQVGDLAAALLELIPLELAGPLHVAGADGVSRAAFAELVAARPVRSAAAPAARPLDCRLDSSRAGRTIGTPLRGVRTVLG